MGFPHRLGVFELENEKEIARVHIHTCRGFSTAPVYFFSNPRARELYFAAQLLMHHDSSCHAVSRAQIRFTPEK